MARIRTVKPEFWTSEQVMDLSVIARLLFIGLWNFCDDAGRAPWKPRQIKAQIYPGDDLKAEDVHGMLLELQTNGLIIGYTVDDREYLQVTGWKHQLINRPQKPKYPPPPKPHSLNDHDKVTPPFTPDRKGRDTIGKERKKDPSGPKKEIQKIGLNDLSVKMFEDFAKDKAPDVNILLEIERFRDYWRSRGKRFKDYPAAFRNWLRKAQEFHDERKGKANSGADPPGEYTDDQGVKRSSFTGSPIEEQAP